QEYRCDHIYFIVGEWCPEYIDTHRRCRPVVVSIQILGYEYCGRCRERQKSKSVSWAHMIKQPTNRTQVPQSAVSPAKFAPNYGI
ncbi:unnamed protein product, partial [Clonostachys rosea f. rosea IK726]